jgi:hypothetical protein
VLRGRHAKEQDRYLPPHQTWGLASHPTELRGEKPVKDTTQESLFPKFDYYLDESDPDIVILRRQDGAFVAAFSARGATREGIVEAAKEDYGRLIEAKADHLGLRGDDGRKRSA